MRVLLARIQCRLFGHPDTVLAWGPIFAVPGEKPDREVREVCTRCQRVVGRTTFRREGERWTANLGA
jgi:hypothetical protein